MNYFILFKLEKPQLPWLVQVGLSLALLKTYDSIAFIGPVSEDLASHD